MLDLIGKGICIIFAVVLVISIIILVCGAIYAQDKANKKY